jgi:hypothetical protein
VSYLDRLRQFRNAVQGLMSKFAPKREERRGGIDGMGNYCEHLKIAPKFPVEHLTEFEIVAHEWEITRYDREAVLRAMGASEADLALMDQDKAKELAKTPKERLKLT